MVVPVYNERRIIEKKIDNVHGLLYPKEKFEVIFVDGGSSDGTDTIIQKHIDSGDRSIRLIRQQGREGIFKAYLAGVMNSNSEIIMLTDAAAYHDPDAVTFLVDRLIDPKVGVVCGRSLVLNESEGLLPKLEKAHRNVDNLLRNAESRVDSTPVAKGEILVARRKICMSLAPKVERLKDASFDSCVCCQARLEGFRAIFEPGAVCYEYAPSNLRDRFERQTIRAAVLIGALSSFRAMCFKRQYGDFGTIILPARLTMLLVLPWLILSGLTLLIADVFLDPIFAISICVVCLIAMLSTQIRALMVAFVTTQIVLAVASLRLLFRGGAWQMIDSVPSTRR
jgi:cellulose synthase/poly-beta-1,6-N-acetylglucosamine synthase-like glycosyltransferase